MLNEEQKVEPTSENDNSKKPLVSGSGILGRKAPFCRCLYEIENGLQRTKFCFRACNEQKEILRQREKDGR
jgi:hypothetical protein